jgi:hypothetical protein
MPHPVPVVLLARLALDRFGFYRHFGFHQLQDRRLWRRLSDIAQAVGNC